MALVVGSATIDAEGGVAGSGLAFSLAKAEMDALAAMYAALGQAPPAPTAATRAYIESRSKDFAEAIVAAVGAADVRVPKDGLDPGVPSAVRVLAGAVE